MPELFDKQTRRVVPVRAEEVPSLLSSGRYRVRTTNGEIPMVDRAGELYSIPADQMWEAFDEGYQLEGDVSQQARADEDKYGGLKGALITMGIGGVKSYTGGLGTQLAVQHGIRPEVLAKFEEKNPASMMVGEIGSFFLPGPNIARGAAALGRLGGKTLAPLAKALSKNLGGKGTERLIEATIDGALYTGGTQLIHDVALERAEFSGQTLAQYTTVGAATGLAFGGVVNALAIPGAALVNKAGGGIKRMSGVTGEVKSAGEFFDRYAEETALKATGPGKVARDVMATKWRPERLKRAKEWLANVTVHGTTEKIIGAARGIPKAARDIALQLQAEVDRLGPVVGDFYKGIDRAMRQRRVDFGVSPEALITKLQSALRDPQLVGGKDAVVASIRDAIHKTKETALKHAALRPVDPGMSNRLPALSAGGPEFLEGMGLRHWYLPTELHRLVREALEPSGKFTGDLALDILELNRNQVDDIYKALKDELPRIDLDTSWLVRRNYDKTANWNSRSEKEAFETISNIWREELRAQTKAAQNIRGVMDELGGGNAYKEFLDAQEQYGFAATFEKFARNEAERVRTNNTFSPRDMVAGIGGGIVGGGPVYAAGTALVNRELRMRGNTMVAMGARKLAAILKIREKTTKEITDRAAQVVRGRREQALAVPKAQKAYDKANREWEVAKEKIDDIEARYSAAREAVEKESGGIRHIDDELEWNRPETKADRAYSKLGDELDDAHDPINALLDVAHNAMDKLKAAKKAARAGKVKGVREALGKRPGITPVTVNTLSSITFTGQKPEGTTKKEVVGDLIGQINDLTLKPDLFALKLSSQLEDMEKYAPMIAQEIAETKTRMVQFLQSKAPKETPYSNFQPSLYKDSHLSPEAVSQFERYLMAALNPVGTIYNDLDDGVLMNETIETVNAIYPALLNEIRMKIGEKLAEDDQVLSAAKMQQLAKLFGESMMAYQTPEFMQRQQRQFQVESEGSMAGVKPSSASKGQMSTLAETAVDTTQLNLRK
jgi:hypothetical protein